MNKQRSSTRASPHTHRGDHILQFYQIGGSRTAKLLHNKIQMNQFLRFNQIGKVMNGQVVAQEKAKLINS
jgi:hypothetical protein